MNNIKNILVTGGCGFIGSNFINYFLKRYNNCKIINLDKLYYCSSENNIEKNFKNSENYIFIKGDIGNADLVNHILNTYKIDCVINFAAQSHVDNSFKDPLQFTEDNIKSAHIFLDVCRKYNKLYRFLHISTDEVYGESEHNTNEKKTETTMLNPTNPYAASKAAIEHIVKSYIYSFKMPIIITRSNNVYGLNQYHEKLIPKFVKLLKNNKKVTIQGDGSNKRTFLHTDDVSEGYLNVISNGKIGEIYNIGSEEEYSVLDIAKILIMKIKKTENYEEWIEYIDDRLFNDNRYHISYEKIEKELNWKPYKNFDEEIDKIILDY